MPGAGMKWSESDWPGRAAGIPDADVAYSFADKQRFRAGSYSGYGEWRNSLATVAGFRSARHAWENAHSGPFFELLNFADNDGVIGPEVSAKLARDGCINALSYADVPPAMLSRATSLTSRRGNRDKARPARPINTRLLNTLAAIAERKAGFRSLADTCVDTTTPHGRLILTVLGGLAEFEKELIRARTSEGRARAKARGVKLGRKPKLTELQKPEAVERRDRDGEPVREIARSYNVSHSTISRLAARRCRTGRFSLSLDPLPVTEPRNQHNRPASSFPVRQGRGRRRS